MRDDAAALENAARDMPGRGVGQKNRGGEEGSSSGPGDFRQQITRSGRAEDGLAGAAENSAHVGTFALLEQDGDHQSNADGDMNYDCGRDHLVDYADRASDF